MWNLKYATNEPIYETNRLTDIENRLMGAEGEGLAEGWRVRLRSADVSFYIWNG